MEKMKQKILVFGAGVIGSLYAAKLKEAGHDVAVVARGQRYEDLKKHGIVLEYFDSGERLTEDVKVFERMPAEDYFDFCLVPVQKTQLEGALDRGEADGYRGKASCFKCPGGDDKAK